MALGDQNHTTPISVMPHTSNETPTSVTEEPSVALPPEVWTMIVGNLDGPSQNELAFLWMTVRNVSKSIRNEVERVFRKEHIRKMKLICDCANLDENDPDRASFATAKEDQERAARAFRGVCYKLGYRDKDPLMRNLKPLPDIGHQPSRTSLDEEHTEKASPIFQMRGGISDCGIVGMKLNPESSEVSIDWKATLTKFFGRRLAASRIDMLAYDPAWPSEERVEILWERGERRCLINAPNDRAAEELQLRLLQDQIRAWRIKCEKTLGEPRLSAEGLCKRRIADLELNLDDDGRVGRGRSFRDGGIYTYDGDGYPQLPRWR